MNKKIILILMLSGHSVWSAPFSNLNFESVVQPLTILDPEFRTVPVGQALPGWQALINGVPMSTVVYNNRSLSGAGVSLYLSGAIQGNYLVKLYSGLTSPLPTAGNASIAQTGLIPSDAQSLQLKTGPGPFGGPFIVSIGGSTLSMTPVFSGLNPAMYSGDISAYAGQVAELRITVPYDGIAPFGQAHTIDLDDIQFSTEPVPEPSVIALLTLAGAALVWRMRRRATSPHSGPS